MRRLAKLCAAAALALVAGAARAQQIPPEDFPGLRLEQRLEAYLEREKPSLRENLGHYGLVFAVEPTALAAFMRQIVVFGEGDDSALGAAQGAELHGGGVLGLLLAHWRPKGRSARLDDRFWFERSRRSLALAEIYAAHQRQLFLPGAPGSAGDETGGAIPAAPELPRMRFRFPAPTGALAEVETDAYTFLGLLVAHEADYSRTWLDQRGQRLSVDLLLRSAWDYYLARRSTEASPQDHSNLHLVELLLDFARRRQPPLDPDPLKRRFLAVELGYEERPGDDWTEILGHHAESLGHLVAEPRVAWSADEKRRVKDWLGKLEREHSDDLEDVALDELPHLLRGLRLLREHRARLDESTPAGPAAPGPGVRSTPGSRSS